MLVIVFLCLPCASAAAGAAQESPALRVLGDSNNFPFEWYDKSTKSLRGIDVDILSMISEKSGVGFTYVYKDNLGSAWETMKNGGADMIAGVYVDDTLAKEYNLVASAQYTTEDSMAVVRSGGAIDPEGGLTVAVNASFIGMQEYLKNTHPGWKQVRADTFDGCLGLVSGGEADLTFIDIVSLQISSPLFDHQDLKLLPELQVSLPIYLGMSSGIDPGTAARINGAIASLDEGDIEQAVINNTSVDRSTFSLKNFVRYHTAAAAAVLVLFVVLTAAAASLMYRARLRERSGRQLMEQNAKLEKANRAKSEFLSLVSHDMLTPLNGIIGMTHIAGRQRNPPETADCLAKIDVSSKFLLGLISDVLNIAKTDNGEIVLRPEPYTAAEFMEYIESVIRPLCDGKNVKFTLEANPLEEQVPLMDRLRSDQMLFNLLSNAVKYTPEGGAVTVRLGESITPGGKLAMEVGVEDTGVGMSAEFQKVMFEPFAQEGRNDVSDDRGSGIGLAIVKRLADLMGGTIDVRSAPGKGTAITLRGEFGWVPAETLPGKGASGEDAEYASLAGLHVLLCEDHPLNQEIARALLQEKKMTVDVAENGQRGAEMFAGSPSGYYGAVLMDIRMPVLDGYEATRRIRELRREDAETVPIIAMTADAFEDDVKKCMEVGMDGHISKPIDAEKLYSEIISAVRTKSRRKD